MRRYAWLAALLWCTAAPAGFVEKPIVAYRMDARLDTATRIIHGTATLAWYNQTAQPVPDLQFHLYLNAFRNDQSTWLREARREGGAPNWPGGEQKWGWEEVDHLVVDGRDLTSAITYIHPDDDNADDRTVVRVALPRPVPPRGTIQVQIAFRSKLPRVLARTGYAGDFYFAGQWFPKIGVWEDAGERGRAAAGWNCHQFHANTEFYADYGTWDVRLTVPQRMVVGATGVERSRTVNADGTATWNFYQEDVHDFAWTAQPDFIRAERIFSAGREVTAQEVAHWSRVFGIAEQDERLSDVRVILLLQPEHRGQADRYFRAVFSGIKYFGLWYGRYPYETITVVDPPYGGRNAGGMEYPTLITGGTHWLMPSFALAPEGVTIHEFGHQFWYGLVGNNEFEEAWLDEGFNTYSTAKVFDTAYRTNYSFVRVFGIPIQGFVWLRLPVAGGIPIGIFGSAVPYAAEGQRGEYLRAATSDTMEREGWRYRNSESYAVNSYMKPALVLETLEGYLGDDVMTRVMRAYQQRWRFRHPSAADFIRTAEEVSGQDLKWYFDQVVYGSGTLDYGVELESGNTVLVRRHGDVVFPVKLMVVFDDGKRVFESWDGKYRWQRYTYSRPEKIAYAQIDPGNRVVLDTNFQNNSALAKTNWRPVQKWYLKWVFWLENLFLASSFFA